MSALESLEKIFPKWKARGQHSAQTVGECTFFMAGRSDLVGFRFFEFESPPYFRWRFRHLQHVMLEIIEFALVGNNAPKRCVPYLTWCQLRVRHWRRPGDRMKWTYLFKSVQSRGNREPDALPRASGLGSGAARCVPPSASHASHCAAR